MKDFLIFDGFMIFNELDLLEIRLNVLNHVVDKFILVEGTHTHSGKPKPLYYDQAKDEPRFKKFENKIIHIIEEFYVNKWNIHNKRVLEIQQRNAIQKGFIGDNPNDILLVSDIDEIINPDKLHNIIEMDTTWRFRQKLFYYYFNMKYPHSWTKGSVARRRKYNRSPQKLRKRFSCIKWIENGGWHYSYLGGVEEISNKLTAATHTEHDIDYFKNAAGILHRITNGILPFRKLEDKRSLRIVPLDAPKYIMDNKEKFSKYIYKEKRSKMKDIYNTKFFEHRRSLKLNWRVPIICSAIIAGINPKSILDLGCGLGDYVKGFLEAGIDAWGIEGSPACIPSLVCKKGRVLIFDLSMHIELSRKYELAMSLEVAEHIEYTYVNIFIENLCGASDKILFSAARPGQSGAGHVNCQPKEYWIEKFKDVGYIYNTTITEKVKSKLTNIRHKWMKFYYNNLLYFEKVQI